MLIFHPIEDLATDSEVRQYPNGTVTVQCANTDLQQQAQVLVIQYLLSIQRVALLQYSFQQLLRPVETFHDTLHPILKFFAVHIHSSRPPFQ